MKSTSRFFPRFQRAYLFVVYVVMKSIIILWLAQERTFRGHVVRKGRPERYRRNHDRRPIVQDQRLGVCKQLFPISGMYGTYNARYTAVGVSSWFHNNVSLRSFSCKSTRHASVQYVFTVFCIDYFRLKCLKQRQSTPR